MIRRTLPDTQRATFSINLPDERAKGMPTPMGTGFFVSEDGWFVTAAHVVTKNNQPDGEPRDDIKSTLLTKELRPIDPINVWFQNAQLELIEPVFDFALLKLDFGRNNNQNNQEYLNGRTGFYHLTVSTRQLEEGEPVYSFGYPLSTIGLDLSKPYVTVGTMSHCPRTTSAIVASTMDIERIRQSPNDPQVYVLDKALNYGNSGGPIVAVSTGRVHALCSRFQPMPVPQPHLKDNTGRYPVIRIPSLYGIVSSLHNEEILSLLRQKGVPVSDE